MKLTIEISMDNAAFEGPLGPTEVSRILGKALSKVEGHMMTDTDCTCDAAEIDDKLFDINGNTVGRVRLEQNSD